MFEFCLVCKGNTHTYLYLTKLTINNYLEKSMKIFKDNNFLKNLKKVIQKYFSFIFKPNSIPPILTFFSISANPNSNPTVLRSKKWKSFLTPIPVPHQIINT